MAASFPTIYCALRSCRDRHDPEPRKHYGPTGIPHATIARIQDAARAAIAARKRSR